MPDMDNYIRTLEWMWMMFWLCSQSRYGCSNTCIPQASLLKVRNKIKWHKKLILDIYPITFTFINHKLQNLQSNRMTQGLPCNMQN